MSGFLMRPEDELPHAPDSSTNFNESVYTNGFDSIAPVGAWMRLGNRVNEGYSELSVCAYLPDGRIACQFQRPSITRNDHFDAGGLTYSVIEPLRKVSMTYEGELLVLKDANALRDPKSLFADAPRAPGRIHWLHEASSPVHGGEPTDAAIPTMYGRDFSLGHFNQHSRVRGEIRVGQETWPIDGRGWRDHSWGPRYWQAIYFYRLFIANFPDGDGFMLLKITDEKGVARRQGVLLIGGRYEEVIDMDLFTEWTDRQDPAGIRLSVRTANRTAIISGEVMELAPLRNRRKANGKVLESRIAEGFTRFTWDGRDGHGITEYIERIENGRLVGYPL
jgi:hypothetical protein